MGVILSPYSKGSLGASISTFNEVKRKNLTNDTRNNPQQRPKRQREPAELLYGFRFPQPSLEGMLAAKKIHCPNECSQCSIG